MIPILISGLFLFPVPGGTITSNFGIRYGTQHNGIDISLRNNAKVVSSDDGVVLEVGYDRQTGNYIVIRHGSFVTRYSHLNSVLVYEGVHVTRGQVIGRLGSTGTNTTGPHLHFEVQSGDVYLNPTMMININTQ
jgi:murein DD-endopeptidase MepM/ murein hydrolase activator NlpD